MERSLLSTANIHKDTFNKCLQTSTALPMLIARDVTRIISYDRNITRIINEYLNFSIIQITMEGVPVNIVKTKSDGKLVLSEEELRKIVCSDGVKDLEVAVVAIAGAYRTGKSFLMNLLAGYLQLYQEGEVPVNHVALNAINVRLYMYQN